MKAIRSGDHLFLVGSDMLAWTRGAIFFATWVALGWVGWHYLTSGRSELNCRRIEPTVVNCTFTDRGLFHKEIIELPNNQLEQADVL